VLIPSTLYKKVRLLAMERQRACLTQAPDLVQDLHTPSAKPFDMKVIPYSLAKQSSTLTKEILTCTTNWYFVCYTNRKLSTACGAKTFGAGEDFPGSIAKEILAICVPAYHLLGRATALSKVHRTVTFGAEQGFQTSWPRRYPPSRRLVHFLLLKSTGALHGTAS